MAIPPRLAPRAGPNVWTGDTMPPSHWMVPVGGEAARELLAAAAAAAGGARPQRPEHAPLPRLGPVLRDAADRLEHGAGFALLRGLAADRFTVDTAAAALLVVAAHLGAALPQDAEGALVAPPMGAAGQLLAEPADAVAVFCLRPLPEGEAVLLHSAANLHNELLRRDRAALAALHAPLPHRRAGAAEPMMLPVFGTTGGAFVGRYDRASVLDALLNPAQAAAVSALDAAANAPGQALAIPLRAGDLLLLNPHLVWRRGSAASAVDGTGPRVLGVWLSTRTSRALPESFRAVFGETAAGARRGGASGGPGMVGG